MRGLRQPRIWLPAVAIAAVALSVLSPSAVATTAAKHAHQGGKVLVTTRKLKVLGQVLVDSRGRTLYMFVPDKHRKVTCTGSCAVSWPPLKLAKGKTLAAGGKAQRKLLGSDRDPAGGRVVTYHGWPLYTYIGDTKPGSAFGQAIKLNGGYWYVLSPSGKVIKKTP